MRLRSFLGWGVFLVLIAIIVHAMPPGLAMYHFLNGKRLFNSGQFESAAIEYQQAIASKPDFARAYVELGDAYIGLEKYSEAEEALKKAAAIEDDSCASCGLGMVYRIQGRSDEAEKVLRHSIKVNPSDSCPYTELGRMYYDKKDYTRATEAFTQSVKIRPNAVTYHFLGNSIYNSSGAEESIEPYLEATHLNPNYENVFVDLGCAYHQLGRYREATGAFEQAVKLKPDDQKARAFLGVTHFILGNRQGAMEQYQWLLTKNPKLAAELLNGFQELSPDVQKLERMRLRGTI